jgi:hypothetical protein
MSSSDPQAPVEPGAPRSPSTQEIPVVQPAAGATATQQLPPHPGASTPSPVHQVDPPAPTGPVDFVPGLPGPGSPPPPPPVRPAPAVAPHPMPTEDAPETATARAWPHALQSDSITDTRPRKERRARAPRDRAALLGVGLTVLSVALLELGLTMRGGDLESYWQRIPLWSAFATACALLGLLAFAAFFPAGNEQRSGPAWRVAAAGLVGLAVFWLLVVLPVVDSDRGFVLTAALAALGGALWVGPRRKN